MSEVVGYRSHGRNISSLYPDLISLEKCLKELKAEEPGFRTKVFGEWCEQRKVTIETIEDLQNKINNLCVGANVVRGVGAVAGIAGIFAGIVGMVLEEKGHESADNFKTVGKYCGGAGLAALASSALLEVGLTQSFMNDVERVLKKDIELTEPLRKWVEFSRKVDSLLEEHFQYSIMSDVFAKVMEVVGHCMEALEAGEAEVRDLMNNLGSIKITDIQEVTEEVLQIVMNFFKRIYRNPKLLEPLKNIWKIFKETPHTFEFAKLGCTIYCKIYKVLNASRLSGLLGFAGIACPQIGHTFVRFAFDAVTIGANVVTLILAAQNIKEGKSQYSDALDDIMNALRSEQKEVIHLMNERVRRPNTQIDYIPELYVP